jgi:hypothetical protein
MTEYLPWWMTAILLAFVTLGFYFANNRTLGVSGSWARVVQWKSDRALDEASAAPDFWNRVTRTNPRPGNRSPWP